MRICSVRIYLGQKLSRVSVPVCDLTSRLGITPSPQEVIASASFKTMDEVLKSARVLRNQCLVFILRHGQTDLNREGKAQGWAQNLMNQEGRKQAAGMRDMLEEAAFCNIYSSTLARSSGAADIIAEPHGLEPRRLGQLKEIHLGCLIELTWNGPNGVPGEIESRFPKAYARFKNRPGLFRAPGGESFKDVDRRAKRAIDLIVRENLGGSVAIVGHGWINKLIFMRAFGIPISQFWQVDLADNTAVDVIMFNRTRTKNELYLYHYSPHLSEDEKSITSHYQTKT